jgi:exopolysaccharide biosynthesis polyprenyl glycosylphosphotransferase
LHTLRSRGHCVHRVLVVGHVGSAAVLVRQVRRARYHGLHIVGACVPRDHPRDALADKYVPVVGGLDEVADAVDRVAADTVAVLACPEIDDRALRQLSWQLQRRGTDLLVAPALTDVAGPRLAIRPVDGLPLLHVEQPELAGGRRFLKAAVDRTVATLAIAALSPALVAIAVAVRATSRGPVVFRQTRVGLRGEEFTMLKFRSMVPDAEDRRQELVAYNENDGVLFKIRSDPRVTAVGRWLRRYSLDELPQLFNVLNGTMSLVGPRPPLPGEVAVYADDVTRRLLVKPGLTGLWQISGRSDLSWDESIRLDLRYVENWSLALDLMILWKTMFVVLRGRGAY